MAVDERYVEEVKDDAMDIVGNCSDFPDTLITDKCYNVLDDNKEVTLYQKIKRKYIW